MENNFAPEKPRPFAAKYKYKWQGWAAIVIGVAWAVSGEIVTIILGVLLLVLGVYLLRGKGQSPKSIERSKKKADKLQSKIDDATRALETASGGKAVVAYRNLENVMKSTKMPDYQAQFQKILADIKFDVTSIQSDHIGTLSGPSVLNKTPIEVYKNWIISGQNAFDVDVSTRGEVNVEGNVQIDAKGKKHDLRTATIHFASTNWAHTFPFNLEQVSEARKIVSQLSAVIDSMKPTAATSADIAKVLETIMSNSGQPAAEKLKQLSDLRFQRLVSDAEFEAAKAKILGI